MFVCKDRTEATTNTNSTDQINTEEDVESSSNGDVHLILPGSAINVPSIFQESRPDLWWNIPTLGIPQR